MASLFKPQFTRVVNGKRVKKRTAKWYGQWKDATGKVRRTPLHANKGAAQLMLADLVRGVTAPPNPTHLPALLNAWEAAMTARGTSAVHVRLVMGRVRSVVDGCGWHVVGKLDAEAATSHLANLTGPEGISPKTRNDYADALRSFGRWLVDRKHASNNPFEGLRRVGTGTDRRHDRRALQPAELAALLTATLASPTTFRGLTGRDRHALYLTAASTGFRASELASLAQGAFRLEQVPPVVHLAAGSAKNRRPAIQPIPIDVAPIFRSYLAKSSTCPVWPGTWVQDAAEMVAIDLAAAGIPYVVQGTDGPLYADFHSLRHLYISLLDRPDVSLKQAMTLARHSDPKLTMRTYARSRMADLATVVNGMPLARVLALQPGQPRATAGRIGYPSPTTGADDTPTEPTAQAG